MQADLDRYGVNVVALSKDTVAEANTHRTRDNVRLTLLADPKLEVIRQYGVEHQKALGFTTGGFLLFGLPASVDVPSYKNMAIPTSLLVDESGVIRWVDQTEDYRLRSSPERVLQAVERAFT